MMGYIVQWNLNIRNTGILQARPASRVAGEMRLGWEYFNSGSIFMHNVGYLYLKPSFKINNQGRAK